MPPERCCRRCSRCRPAKCADTGCWCAHVQWENQYSSAATESSPPHRASPGAARQSPHPTARAPLLPKCSRPGRCTAAASHQRSGRSAGIPTRSIPSRPARPGPPAPPRSAQTARTGHCGRIFSCRSFPSGFAFLSVCVCQRRCPVPSPACGSKTCTRL